MAGRERKAQRGGEGSRSAGRLHGEPLGHARQCHRRMHIHDYEERRWRHLDSCQFKTVIVARVPVVKCPVHGVETVAVPWAEKYGAVQPLVRTAGD